MIDFSNFKIIVDTREQQPWEFNKMEKTVAKLDTGDYSLQGLEEFFCIERKGSVSEFANNITEKRFKDVVERLSKVQHAFLLFEFNLEDILRYPVGSTVPKRMWSKLRISPKFILKHLNELQLLHNVKILFCGDAANAEKMALALMRKMYELYGQPKSDV
jgi:ERCC4-type nuclease